MDNFHHKDENRKDYKYLITDHCIREQVIKDIENSKKLVGKKRASSNINEMKSDQYKFENS